MLRSLSLFCVAILAAAPLAAADLPPNIIVLYADDLGWGDLGCYGHPTIRTPELDRMAREGLRCTSFYSAAEVCTPSRAALLTGRYPIRSGMCDDSRRVLFPDSAGGMPATEVTLAEALRERGYATACVGKWHLGHLPPYLPTRNGFDRYLGIPYSNDMDRIADGKLGRAIFFDPKVEYWNCPLMRNDEVIERPAPQPTLTARYTAEALDVIKTNREKPFFIYLAYAMPHVPLFASEKFAGKSPRGLYGDVIEEIDDSVGQILTTLRDAKLAERTLVVFSSDNGPWLIFNQHGGSAGPFREGKGSTWEGGMRVPGLFWWPGKIAAGRTTSEMASTLDLFPTAVKLAGGNLPEGRALDGHDLSPFLLGESKSPRESMLFYRGAQLFAARLGKYKAHFQTRSGYGPDPLAKHDPPLLFDLDQDPSERTNVAADHAEEIAAIKALVAEHQAKLTPGESQLAKRIEKGK